MAIQGWKLWTVRQKHAPNFGGEEYWWEAEYRNDSGEKRTGCGRTREEAIKRGEEMAAYDFSQPITLSVDDSNEDCPF